MRKVLFSLLLATTMATPAFAQSTAADRAQARQERQAEREKARESRADARQERSQAQQQREQVRQERVEQRGNRGVQAPQRDVRVREPVRQSRPANINERGRPTLGQVRDTRDSVANLRRDQREAVQQQQANRREAAREQQANQREAARQQMQERNAAAREQRQDRRAEMQQQRQQWRDRWVDAARTGRRLPPPTGARPDRPAPPPPTAYNGNYRAPTWNRNWRNSGRYDWRDYRNRHRSTFHVGFYIDPFGWGYHRYNIGWRLWPSYYSSNYWLDDPAMYALPYAPWPYRWVRYYNDAMLVNVFTGQVVDVMYDFFW